MGLLGVVTRLVWSVAFKYNHNASMFQIGYSG